MITNLNIPAMLIERINGERYKAEGTIVEINESLDQCTMQIGNKRKSNVPLDKVYVSVDLQSRLEEGVIDSVKNGIKSAFNYVVRKVKGFFAIGDDPLTMRNIANVAIAYSKGQIDDVVQMSFSSDLIDSLGQVGESIRNNTLADIFTDSINRERQEIVEYWQRVMNEYVANDDMKIEEAVDYVNKTYYKVNPLYESMRGNGKELNEVLNGTGYEDVENRTVVSLRSPGGEQPIYGENVDTNGLIADIKESLRMQIRSDEEDEWQEMSGNDTTKQGGDLINLLIWGAPGIGKSAICEQALEEFEQEYCGSNETMNFFTVNCANMTSDKWDLPKIDMNMYQNGNGDDEKVYTSIDVARSWLPVYPITSDAARNKELNDLYNSSRWLASTREGKKSRSVFDRKTEKYVKVEKDLVGGVVFFDEVARMSKECFTVLMEVTTGRSLGQYRLATHWGLIYAANRGVDMGTSAGDKLTLTEAAQRNRFRYINYTPSMQDWLKWARKKNKATHEANVPEPICQFIENAGEKVWYGCIEYGTYDDYINDADKKHIMQAYNDGEEYMDLLTSDRIAQNPMSITPRAWMTQVVNPYKELIRRLIGVKRYGELLKKTHTNEKGKEVYNGYITDEDLRVELSKLSIDDFVRKVGGIQEVRAVDPQGSIIRFNEDEEDGTYQPYPQNSKSPWAYDYIQAFVMRQIRVGLAGGIKNNVVEREWKEQKSWKNYYTPTDIKSILETGYLSEEPSAENKNMSKRQMDALTDEDPGYLEWKNNSVTYRKIRSMILDSMESNTVKDIDILSDGQKYEMLLTSLKGNDIYATRIKPNVKAAMVKKWKLASTYKYNGTDYCILDDNTIFTSKEQIETMALTLESCSFARYMFNTAMYFIRFFASSHQNFAGEMSNSMTNMMQKLCKKINPLPHSPFSQALSAYTFDVDPIKACANIMFIVEVLFTAFSNKNK